MSSETKEQKEKRLKAVRRTLAQRSRERRYDTRLVEIARNAPHSVGTENFKLTKQVISEKADNFKEKYKSPNSDFQKRLAYLKESLNEEEYQASPEYKISQIVDELVNNAVKDYSDYASITELLEDTSVKITEGDQTYTRQVKKFTHFGPRQEEARLLKKANESFKQVESQVNELINTQFAMSEVFQEFYADLDNLTEETKRVVNGGLTVPPYDPEDDEVKFVKLTHKVETIDPVTNQKVIKEEIREPVLTTVKARIEGDKTNTLHEIDVSYKSVKDEPLFSHEPCPEDVQQGCLGDCYFIATLTAVAANNPDFIRNCMKDNNDGTVTVRLYDKHQNPVYTTVNKTIPMGEVDGRIKPAYARGALWVAMLEKAYVQSGVAINAVESFVSNNTFAQMMQDGRNGIERNSYASIIGGLTQKSTMDLLGEHSMQDDYMSMMIKFPEKPGEGNSKYNSEEKAFFNKVKNAYDRGDAVTAGINRKTTGAMEDNHYVSTIGLPSGHAYSVIGTFKDPDSGKMFIKVKNPHMAGGRVYVNGEAKYEEYPENPGESTVELRDFINTFDDCFAGQYDKSYFEEKNAKLSADDKNMYGDAVEQACTEILETDPAYVWTNSKKFKDLKKAAIALKKEFKKPNPDHKKMDDKLRNFFKAARDYRDDRDARNQDLTKDLKERSMQRYHLADAVTRFEEIYNANQEKNADLQYVDFDECKELALDLGIDRNNAERSQARKAAVENMVKDPEGQVTEAEAAKLKIGEVEQSGLAKIENGLRSHNKTELIKGLCEVIASRSVKAHENEIRPQDIERQLSPESIERVQNHFGKKIEAAMKSISKDDFLSIMKSDNMGDDMARKVSTNLTENARQAEVIREEASSKLQNTINI